MNLDHEKFQGAKELATITTQISMGRALLISLKESEEQYLGEREIKAVQRVKDALTSSENLIKEIGANHDELVGYRTDLGVAHEGVRSLIQSVTDCVRELNEATEALNAQVDSHNANVKKFTEETKRERALIKGEREGLESEKAIIARDKKLIKDQRETLKRAFEELRIKKTPL